MKPAPTMRMSSETSNTFASIATHQASRRRTAQSPSFVEKNVNDNGRPTSSDQSTSDSKPLPPLPPSSSPHDEADLRTQSPSLVEKNVNDGRPTSSGQSKSTSKSHSSLPASYHPHDEADLRTKWAGAERALKKLTDNMSLRNIRDKTTPSPSAKADSVIDKTNPDLHSPNQGDLSDEPMSTRISSRQLIQKGSKFLKELSPQSTSKTSKFSTSTEGDDIVDPDPRSRNYSDLTSEPISTRISSRQLIQKGSKFLKELSSQSTTKTSKLSTSAGKFLKELSSQSYGHARSLTTHEPEKLVRSKEPVNPRDTCLACYRTFDCSYGRDALFQHLEDTGHATNTRTGEREELHRWSTNESVDPHDTCLACYRTFDCSYSRDALFQHLEDTGHATNTRTGEREELHRWSTNESVDPHDTCLACYRTFDCSFGRDALFQHLENTGHATNTRTGEREELHR